MVTEYLECSTDTEYDMVQLFTSLDLKGTHQLVYHGIVTTVFSIEPHTSSITLLQLFFLLL